MCWPQPAQVVLPQWLQVAGEHMVSPSLVLLRTHEAGEESWFLWVVLVALALLGFWNSAHYLIYVLAAARPTCFAALTAGHSLAHVRPFLLNRCRLSR